MSKGTTFLPVSKGIPSSMFIRMFVILVIEGIPILVVMIHHVFMCHLFHHVLVCHLNRVHRHLIGRFLFATSVVKIPTAPSGRAVVGTSFRIEQAYLNISFIHLYMLFWL